jgi:hypothetical protein
MPGALRAFGRPLDSFAYAGSYNEAAGRYRGLCSGRKYG